MGHQSGRGMLFSISRQRLGLYTALHSPGRHIWANHAQHPQDRRNDVEHLADVWPILCKRPWQHGHASCRSMICSQRADAWAARRCCAGLLTGFPIVQLAGLAHDHHVRLPVASRPWPDQQDRGQADRYNRSEFFRREPNTISLKVSMTARSRSFFASE